MPPGGVEADGASTDAEDWLRRWGLTLRALEQELLAKVDRQLGIGDAGQTLAASTASRYRKVARRCVRRAYELGRLPSDPWPPTPRGRSQRKARRKRSVVDIRRLPDPTAMAAIVKAIRSHQPGSRTYQVMTAAVSYVAGLRPSEVVMLRPRALHLPAKGWGTIDVVEADVDWDEPGEPKTGPRSVPIPPELVATLRTWIAEHELGGGDLLFRTGRAGVLHPRTGRARCSAPAAPSNVSRYASTTAGTRALRHG
jgi:integrase